MRDKKRIPKIISELERVWNENPDFRLGQLIVAATRPENPCSSIFYIEDDQLLEGLSAIGNLKNKRQEESHSIPYLEKYPDICRITPGEISISLILEMINSIKREKENFVITPTNLMELNGAPVSDNSWLKKQKERILRLKFLLRELADKGIIEEIEIGYGIKK